MNKKHERGCCCSGGRDGNVKRKVEGGKRRRIGAVVGEKGGIANS
jgi:hypothetical protein